MALNSFNLGLVPPLLREGTPDEAGVAFHR